MTDLLLGLLIASAVAFAGGYIVRAKRRGQKCIGCSCGCSCDCPCSKSCASDCQTAK